MELHRDVEALLAIVNALNACEALVQAEEHPDPITTFTDLKEHHLARQVIEDHLQHVLTYIHSTRTRIGRLPKLPMLSDALWAQALLAQPTLAFLEVDTDGLGETASVIRVLLMNAHKQVLFDTLIRPDHIPPASTLAITGIASQDLEHAPTLREVWPHLVEALTGKYLLSYGLTFDRGMLEQSVQRIECDLPYLLADCLMLRATSYFRASSYPKLADLCRKVGYPLPDRPNQTALHRATGQVDVLHAMASGFTDLPQAAPTASTPDSNSDDEHPF